MGRLAGKIALVTGASRGIGRAIAVALAREGAAIAVNYHSSEAEAKRVVEELNALGAKTMLAQANVSSGGETRDMVQRVVKTWGRIDVMVNNAGITRDKTLRKMTDEDWFEVINTNLNSVYY
jgi:acetoacetyl-CoA reductase/3-oxoacyl-[acyl-carrier protein] reductase